MSKIVIDIPEYDFAVEAVHHTSWGSMLKIFNRVLLRINLDKSFISWSSLFASFCMNVFKLKSFTKQNVTHKDPSDMDISRALCLCWKEKSIATKSSPHFINVFEICSSVDIVLRKLCKRSISLLSSSSHIATLICCRIFSFVQVSSGFFKFLIR